MVCVCVCARARVRVCVSVCACIFCVRVVHILHVCVFLCSLRLRTVSMYVCSAFSLLPTLLDCCSVFAVCACTIPSHRR